jgi:threonyl-tRNA synthetase
MQVTGEKMGKAIRNAELQKIPVVAVIGPRDMEAGVVSLRTYAAGELGQVSEDEVIAQLCKANAEQSDFDASKLIASS